MIISLEHSPLNEALMKLEKILFSALLSAALFFSGTFLASLYGLDPPYIYFHTGIILILISFVMMLVTLVLVMISCYRFFKRRKSL